MESPDEVMTLTGRFLQHYRESANWLERTYKWVPRVGIEYLREVLVDDPDDDFVTGLDERMQKSIDAYRDPWRDGQEPRSEGQFRSSLPLLPLPKVPVR